MHFRDMAYNPTKVNVSYLTFRVTAFIADIVVFVAPLHYCLHFVTYYLNLTRHILINPASLNLKLPVLVICSTCGRKMYPDGWCLLNIFIPSSPMSLSMISVNLIWWFDQKTKRSNIEKQFKILVLGKLFSKKSKSLHWYIVSSAHCILCSQ